MQSAYGFLNKQGAAGAGSSASDTPILCETCLGPNPYVRMSKQHLGQECKTCGRPFTVFRWNPGTGMRFKKTEICTTCAKLKNVCQTCILDLQYGLPTHVRDAALDIQSKIPKQEINRQYYVNNMDAQLEGATSAISDAEGSAARPTRAGHELLKKLARPEPDYRRNRPHLCSFYARGMCKRGDECPYRHELPPDTHERHTIQDRYHGTDDPSARRILRACGAAQALVPPEDKSITTLFLSSLPEDADEEQLRTYFTRSVPGLDSEHIRTVTVVPSSHCAFVNFAEREHAERAADACTSKVDMGGKEVRVTWGRNRTKKAGRPPASTART